jgi:hypothetical protein
MTSARGTGKVPKRLEDALGARLLDHGDDDREIGEDEQDQGFMPVAERQIDDAAGDEEGDHRLAQHLEDDPERRASVRAREFVVPLCVEPRLRFGFGEAERRARRRRGFSRRQLSVPQTTWERRLDARAASLPTATPYRVLLGLMAREGSVRPFAELN